MSDELQSEAKIMDSIMDTTQHVINQMHITKAKAPSSYEQIPKMQEVGDERSEHDLITEPDQEHPIAPEVSLSGGYIHSEPVVGNPGKLFLGGLSYNTTQDDVAEHFSTYGKVVDVVVMKDKVTGKSRGFGFVTFAQGDIAAEIVAYPHVIKGRTIDVKYAIPRERSNSRNSGGLGKNSACSSSDIVCKTPNGGEKSGASSKEQPPSEEDAHSTQKNEVEAVHNEDHKIFVGGLPPSASDTDLQLYFSKFGPVTHCAVMIDHNTLRSRGFGFVTFKSVETLLQVIDHPNHDICGKWVEVKRAESREHMAERSNKSLARQHNANWYAMSPEYNSELYPMQPPLQPMYANVAPMVMYGYNTPMYANYPGTYGIYQTQLMPFLGQNPYETGGLFQTTNTANQSFQTVAEPSESENPTESRQI